MAVVKAKLETLLSSASGDDGDVAMCCTRLLEFKKVLASEVQTSNVVEAKIVTHLQLKERSGRRSNGEKRLGKVSKGDTKTEQRVSHDRCTELELSVREKRASILKLKRELTDAIVRHDEPDFSIVSRLGLAISSEEQAPSRLENNARPRLFLRLFPLSRGVRDAVERGTNGYGVCVHQRWTLGCRPRSAHSSKPFTRVSFFRLSGVCLRTD